MLEFSSMKALCKENCKDMRINHKKMLPNSCLRKTRKEMCYLNDVMVNIFVKNNNYPGFLFSFSCNSLEFFRLFKTKGENKKKTPNYSETVYQINSSALTAHLAKSLQSAPLHFGGRGWGTCEKGL